MTGTPIPKKSAAPDALNRFIHEYGVPIEMLTDGAKELHLGDWQKRCKLHNIAMCQTEPHSPWQNPSELAGGIIKRKVRHALKRSAAPVRLWDYAWEYQCALRSLTAADHIMLGGSTPFQKVNGYTPNIAEYLLCNWYDWVWYHDPDDPNKENLGRWLGPSHDTGQGLAYNVLTAKGTVVIRNSVYPLSNDKHQIPTNKTTNKR